MRRIVSESNEEERSRWEPEIEIEALLTKFRDHSATVAVIGLGYVGLPLLRIAAETGFTMLGLDIDMAKVDCLNAGRSYFHHIGDDAIAALRHAGLLSATNDFSRLTEVDTVLLCIPTPLTPHREPDLGFVIRTTESVVPFLKRGQLIVLESTTYPGTTREVVLPILQRSGLRSGRDFFLAYSPEREDPGNRDFGTAQLPKVIGADGPGALRLAQALYKEIFAQIVPVSSPETAEAVKLTENIFRSVNIALVNELKVVFDAMGIDVWEVIDAAKTKPFGYMAFYPGPGLGGHCVPIDPFYLTWKAREYEVATRFIELAGQINTAMPRRIVEKVADVLSARSQRALNGTRVLLIGVSYKKNIDDIRESPALAIMKILTARGAEVRFYDPLVRQIPSSRTYSQFTGQLSIGFSVAEISSFHVSIICTDHDMVDYKLLVNSCPIVVDTRNICSRLGITNDRVVKA